MFKCINKKSSEKNYYNTLQPMKSNSLKYSSTQTVHLVELKIGMYIIGQRPTYCIDFGEFRIVLLQVYNKDYLYITA